MFINVLNSNINRISECDGSSDTLFKLDTYCLKFKKEIAPRSIWSSTDSVLEFDEVDNE